MPDYILAGFPDGNDEVLRQRGRAAAFLAGLAHHLPYRVQFLGAGRKGQADQRFGADRVVVFYHSATRVFHCQDGDVVMALFPAVSQHRNDRLNALGGGICSMPGDNRLDPLHIKLLSGR